MGAALIRLDDLRVFHGEEEPRVQDLRIAEALGFKRPSDIRYLIERNRARLEVRGIIRTARIIQDGAGRPATAYWLTEWQAIRVVQWSETPNADAMQGELADLFIAWRRGDLTSQWQAPATGGLNDLFDEVNAKLDQQGIKLEQQCQLQYQMQDNIITIKQYMESRLPQRIQRPSKEDERILYQVVHLGYRNKCPIDKTTRLTDDKGNKLSGHLDHWHGHQYNEIETLLPVSIPSHLKLTADSNFRKAHTDAFNRFHIVRETLISLGKITLRKPIPKSKSATIHQPGQSSFFLDDR